MDHSKDLLLSAAGPDAFFTPVLDIMKPECYGVMLGKYRTLAAQHGVLPMDPVCYLIRAGFTLKSHAPDAGPCYAAFRHVQNWDFVDVPTTDCLVFVVPRILAGSVGKTVSQQRQILADFRAKLALPAHHMSGFGDAGLVAGLILAHYKATEERIPLDESWVRTDTCGPDGDRLGLGGFSADGLVCGGWVYGGDAGDDPGVFAIGIEPLAA
jgi:hypothetical protein